MPEICHVLVLAPGATSQETALEYRPFSLTLRTLLATAKTDAETTRIIQKLRYREYEVFPYFFFGKTPPLTAAVIAGLRGVPSAILDCDVYARTASAPEEHTGLELALTAFRAQAFERKQLLKVPRSGSVCPKTLDGSRMTSEEKLLAYLENDLWGHPFAELGDEHPEK